MDYHLWSERLQQGGSKRYSVISAVLVVLLGFSLLVYFVCVPFISQTFITKVLELRNGSAALTRWRFPPTPRLMKVYLWNMTNARQVSQGEETPVFKEIGPYVYERYTKRVPLTYKENAITYLVHTTFNFRKDLTEPLTLEDKVVTLNVGLYGAAIKVHSLAPGMVSLINQVAPVLFPGQQSIFSPVTVSAYLFDGVTLHCTNITNSFATVFCNFLPRFAPPNIRQKENSSDFAYSFFAHKNNTLTGPFEIDRGLKDIHDLGRLLSFKGSSKLKTWEVGSVCDEVRGTDPLIFSPFLSQSDVIDIYNQDICQIVPLFFELETKLKGLKVMKFSLADNWLGNVTSNTDNSCFCEDPPSKMCSSNGVRDISKCMNIPVVMSLPHFLMADEKFSIYAQGMKPDKALHSSQLFIEPQTGTPVKGARKIQFNMFLKRIKGFNMVENVSEGLFPLIWIEEGAELSDDLLSPLKTALTVQWSVNCVCVSLTVLTSLALCCMLLTLSWLKCCSGPNNQVTDVPCKPSDRQLPLPQLTLARSLYNLSS